MHGKLKTVWGMVWLGAVAAVGSSPAGAAMLPGIAVDDFTDGALSRSPIGTPTSTTQTGLDPSAVLGGERLVGFIGFGLADAANASLEIDPAGGGTLDYDGSAVTGFVEGPILVYGQTNLSLAGGLAPLNLDLSGPATAALAFDFSYYDVPGGTTNLAAGLFVEDPGGFGGSAASVSVDVIASPTPFTLTVPLSAFAPALPLDDIDGIDVLFGTPPGASFGLRSIYLVPEPASAAALALGCVGVAYRRQRQA